MKLNKQKYGWWKNAVFYQIYPRSFMDSDGDGIGDLVGVHGLSEGNAAQRHDHGKKHRKDLLHGELLLFICRFGKRIRDSDMIIA